jgi:hypothetical protein
MHFYNVNNNEGTIKIRNIRWRCAGIMRGIKYDSMASLPSLPKPTVGYPFVIGKGTSLSEWVQWEWKFDIW